MVILQLEIGLQTREFRATGAHAAIRAALAEYPLHIVAAGKLWVMRGDARSIALHIAVKEVAA